MPASPLEISNYFEDRVKDMYPVPPGIVVQLFDANFNMPGKEPEWRVTIANVNHLADWEAPWGRIDGPDFSRMFFTIALEIEERFGIRFPRKVTNDKS